MKQYKFFFREISPWLYQSNSLPEKFLVCFEKGKIETKLECYDNYYPLKFSHNNNHGHCSALYQLQFILEDD